MKEAHQQMLNHLQQTDLKNDSNNSFIRKRDRNELSEIINSKSSLISIDGLLDGITALVLDCEPIRKNKNIDNFLFRCKLKFY